MNFTDIYSIIIFGVKLNEDLKWWKVYVKSCKTMFKCFHFMARIQAKGLLRRCKQNVIFLSMDHMTAHNWRFEILFQHYFRIIFVLVPIISLLFPCYVPIISLLFPYFFLLFPYFSLLFSYYFPIIFLLFSYYFPIISLYFPIFPIIFLFFLYYFPIFSLLFPYYFPIISLLFSYYYQKGIKIVRKAFLT